MPGRTRGLWNSAPGFKSLPESLLLCWGGPLGSMANVTGAGLHPRATAGTQREADGATTQPLVGHLLVCLEIADSCLPMAMFGFDETEIILRILLKF